MFSAFGTKHICRIGSILDWKTNKMNPKWKHVSKGILFLLLDNTNLDYSRPSVQNQSSLTRKLSGCNRVIDKRHMWFWERKKEGISCITLGFPHCSFISLFLIVSTSESELFFYSRLGKHRNKGDSFMQDYQEERTSIRHFERRPFRSHPWVRRRR